MPTSYAIVNENGKCLARLTAGRRRYRMPHGSVVSVDEIVAWCRTCKAFTLAERIRTLEQERTRLKEIFWMQWRHDEKPAFMRDAARCFVDGGIAERSEWWEYLPARKSSPRCLVCGGIEIVVLSEHSEPFANPTGPGTLSVKFTWISATSCLWSNDAITYYSPEGEKLE